MQSTEVQFMTFIMVYIHIIKFFSRYITMMEHPTLVAKSAVIIPEFGKRDTSVILTTAKLFPTINVWRALRRSCIMVIYNLKNGRSTAKIISQMLLTLISVLPLCYTCDFWPPRLSDLIIRLLSWGHGKAVTCSLKPRFLIQSRPRSEIQFTKSLHSNSKSYQRVGKSN
jgi:hypothetical protein